MIAVAEAVAQRAAEHSCARGCADEGEAAQGEVDRPAIEPALDRVVHAEILHRGVEELLDNLGQPVDLIDEEDVARF